MVTLMPTELEVSALVEGGKASGGPPIGPAIGPTGISIKDVVDKINEKTQGFKGLKVPVSIIVDTEAKTFKIKVSIPQTSALLFKELGAEKGASNPETEPIGDISFDQILKIARMKEDSLNALTMRTMARTVIGTAQSCGITIDGKFAPEVLKEIDEGNYDDQLKEEEA
jgi:large subunit ribosomal protein L11